MKKYLILNSDDFGWNDDTFQTTIELFEKNIISSATIMTGREATRKAIEFATHNQKRFSFGLHFNIVDGHEALLKNNNSLTNNIGKFKSSNTQRINALCFKLRKVDIQNEFKLQLKNLFDAGIKVSHVDSHGHLHKFPQILFSIKPILEQYKIKIIRRPQNLFLKKRLISRIENMFFNSFFGFIKQTDYFFMLEEHKEINWLELIIKNIRSGITEIGIHPGTEEPWRKIETVPFLKNDFHKLLNVHNIKLVNHYFLNSIYNFRCDEI